MQMKPRNVSHDRIVTEWWVALEMWWSYAFFIYLFILFWIYCLLRPCLMSDSTLLSYWYSVFICNSWPQHVASFSSQEVLDFRVGVCKRTTPSNHDWPCTPWVPFLLGPLPLPAIVPYTTNQRPLAYSRHLCHHSVCHPLPPYWDSTITLTFSNTTLNWPKYLGLSDSIMPISPRYH